MEPVSLGFARRIAAKYDRPRLAASSQTPLVSSSGIARGLGRWIELVYATPFVRYETVVREKEPTAVQALTRSIQETWNLVVQVEEVNIWNNYMTMAATRGLPGDAGSFTTRPVAETDGAVSGPALTHGVSASIAEAAGQPMPRGMQTKRLSSAGVPEAAHRPEDGPRAGVSQGAETDTLRRAGGLQARIFWTPTHVPRPGVAQARSDADLAGKPLAAEVQRPGLGSGDGGPHAPITRGNGLGQNLEKVWPDETASGQTAATARASGRPQQAAPGQSGWQTEAGAGAGQTAVSAMPRTVSEAHSPTAATLVHGPSAMGVKSANEERFSMEGKGQSALLEGRLSRQGPQAGRTVQTTAAGAFAGSWATGADVEWLAQQAAPVYGDLNGEGRPASFRKAWGGTAGAARLQPPKAEQPLLPAEVDLERITDQVYRMLERKVRIERERRGL